jgi:DNA helicase-2/ATP-dependent DNA helicase PcrA
MMERILQGAYGNYLDAHYDHASLRKEDIRGMISFAAQYRTLEAFLADVALAGEFSGETIVTGPEEQEFVVLSTIHQAKGLEWPIVFIPWLSDGRFPTDFALNTQEDEEEERRVFHVAVTRAKDELYLLVPQFHRSRADTLLMMKPSRFLTELTEDVTEPLELEEGLPSVMVGEKTPRPALATPSPRNSLSNAKLPKMNRADAKYLSTRGVKIMGADVRPSRFAAPAAAPRARRRQAAEGREQQRSTSRSHDG